MQAVPKSAALAALALALAGCQVNVDENTTARIENAADRIEKAAESAAVSAENAAAQVEGAAERIESVDVDVRTGDGKTANTQ